MQKIVEFAVIAVLAAAIWFGVMWGFWTLWSWAVPQVYADGPKNVVAPSFWLFAACWTLLTFIGRAVFGNREK